MKLKHLSLAVMTMGTALGLASQTYASGYRFSVQSTTAQATANASSAEAEDASTLFFNAAGMTHLPGSNFSGALVLEAPEVNYSNASGRTAPTSATPTGSAITGSTSGKISESLITVPQFYLTHQINDKVYAGLGIYVPFAADAKYQPDSVLRYNVNETSLKTIDINPTIAFKLNDRHSVAVGVIAQYAQAKLKQYANFAQAGASYYGALARGAAAAGNASAAASYQSQAMAALAQDGTGTQDGYAKVNADDWGYGFHLAWMWDVTDSTRLGLNYRSKIKHTLSGTADWTVPPGGVGAIASGAGFVSSGVSARIETPESVSLQGMQTINSKWKAYGDLTWTRHSRFDVLSIDYATPKTVLPTGPQATATILTPDWRDTWKLSLGASYQYNDKLQLRGGVAYDQSPVRSADTRISTLPDSNRIWWSLGGKYGLTKNSSLDFAYTYVYLQNASAKMNGYCGGSAPGQVNCVSSYTTSSADYTGHANIVSVQYDYRF